jgi:BirA family biotin operon repressor/biotin-[acetyl-CoA-carboxylase] ligase
LLDGKKLGGILVEGLSLAGGHHAAVTGFGLNCASHPAGTEFPATSLAAAGFAAAPAAVLSTLGAAMDLRLAEWQRGENFASIRAAWLARAHGIGAAIEVRLAGRTLAGLFEAIDPAGALVLKQRDGTRETIAAGDVFPLAGA